MADGHAPFIHEHELDADVLFLDVDATSRAFTRVHIAHRVRAGQQRVGGNLCEARAQKLDILGQLRARWVECFTRFEEIQIK